MTTVLLASSLKLVDIPGIVFTLLGIIGLMAGGFYVAKGSYSKAKSDQQSRDILEYLARIKYLEEESVRTKLENHTLEEKCDVLTRIVTGKEELTDILEELRAHDSYVKEHDKNFAQTIHEVIQLLKGGKDDRGAQPASRQASGA